MPRAVADGVARLRAFDPADPHEITGCIFSSTLSTSIEHLTLTIGLVDGASCEQHYRVLADLGFQAGHLRCGGMVVSAAAIRAFATRFGAEAT